MISRRKMPKHKQRQHPKDKKGLTNNEKLIIGGAIAVVVLAGSK